MKVSVSILNEKDNYKECIDSINLTNCDYLHLDIMDSTFTNTTSFSYEQAVDIFKISDKKIEVHIMSNNLDYLLDKYIKLKPDTISIHYEATDNIEKYIKKIKKNNIKVSIAINPDTKVSEIFKYLDEVDSILVLSVNPGKSGQEYIETVTDKLRFLKKLQPNYSYLIEVDGGINDKTVSNVKKYVDIVVSGSYITNSDDYEEKISSLI